MDYNISASCILKCQSINKIMLLLYSEHMQARRFNTAASHSGRRLNILLEKECALISHVTVTYIIYVYITSGVGINTRSYNNS